MTKWKPIEYRAHNGYDTKKASDEACTTHDPESWGPSSTIQSQAQDADLNVLMERFGITGKMPENPRIPMYGDFTSVGDYRSAIEAVRRADEAFMEIPAKIRAEFENDPQKFLEFTANPANLPRMREMGLAKPEPPKPAPEPVPPTMAPQGPPGTISIK